MNKIKEKLENHVVIVVSVAAIAAFVAGWAAQKEVAGPQLSSTRSNSPPQSARWSLVQASGFDTNAMGWQLGTITDPVINRTRTIEHSVFKWDLKFFEKQDLYAVPNPGTGNLTDGCVSVDARILADAEFSPALSCGLRYRSVDPGSDAYIIAVTPHSGNVQVSKLSSNKNWESLLSVTKRHAVHASGWNKITVMFQGEQHLVYVNGELIGGVTDKDTKPGRTGLMAGYSGEKGVAECTVEFDNFMVVGR